MRRILVVILICFFSSTAMSQTKSETESWIIKQTERNPFEIKHFIQNGLLISQITMASGFGFVPIEKAIPISQITNISYTHTNEYLSYTMTCNTDCAFLLDDSNVKRQKFLFEIYYNFDASFVPRMNKALLHLVKLHGGKATIVKAEPIKEAF